MKKTGLRSFLHFFTIRYTFLSYLETFKNKRINNECKNTTNNHTRLRANTT